MERITLLVKRDNNDLEVITGTLLYTTDKIIAITDDETGLLLRLTKDEIINNVMC